MSSAYTATPSSPRTSSSSMADEPAPERAAARVALGIDPGTAATGYGVVRSRGDSMALVACGVIPTAAGMPPSERLQTLYVGLLGLIDRYRPTEAAVNAL